MLKIGLARLSFILKLSVRLLADCSRFIYFHLMRQADTIQRSLS